MTIAEILGKLQQERDFGSRFPVRMIFTEDLTSYTALVAQLTGACDETVNLADFAKRDVMPQFDKMRRALEAYEGKQVQILSVGEYLRLCAGRELDRNRRQFPDFWERMLSESSRTRYVVPVFCARDTFDRIVGPVSERQEDFLWTLDRAEGPAESCEITLFSPQFAGAVSADAESLEDWLRRWPEILGRKKSCGVITNQYRNAENAFGAIRVKTVDSPFAYLGDVLADADRLDSAWENAAFWAEWIPHAQKGMACADLISEQLNLTAFDFSAVAARWDQLTAFQRELVWLWYRVYPDDGYVSFACKKAERAEEIPERIRDEILSCPARSDAWVEERGAAMQALPIFDCDESYFRKLDFIPAQATRLALLTCKTHEERAYAVKTVSSMLRNGVEPADAAADLGGRYPALATYLTASSGLDAEADAYLAWYRKNKLINRLPAQWYHAVSLDRFDSRTKHLRQTQDLDCFTFWIDGFGAEWLPVFLEELTLRGIRPERTELATAIVPTKTAYNHQWDENDPTEQKWLRLDTLSHRGAPDDRSYFSCIAAQLEVFAEAAARVDELLDRHEYVAITGDHGSSRLAALAFHDPSVVPTPAPQGAAVRCLGRFCEPDPTDPCDFFREEWMQKAERDGKTFLVMRDYHHFQTRGNAAGGNSDEKDVVGEIHGGNTPEERLVPVILVRRRRSLPSLTCRPKQRNVSRKNGRVTVQLQFNRPVSALEVRARDTKGACEQKTDAVWSVTFDGVPEGELRLTVVADGNLIPEEVLVRVGGQGIRINGSMGGLP